ncbi:peptidase [Sphaerisporangium rufum]|uniref:Peptidase n=1 Tax=Sphaerisporangium rufum TaxID=1381558 RepID=A0A919V2Y0_9ACTN|nr:peptidase [Sphaerisporangium rufum]
MASTLLALPAPARPASGEASAAPVGDVRHVTLITGDVVTVRPRAGGGRAVTVRPGKGREKIRFTTEEVDGEIRVTPSDAFPYLVNGLLDPTLFQVGELIDQGYDDRSRPTLPLLLDYADGARAAAVPGVKVTATLNSIDAQAAAPEKGRLADFWKAAVTTADPSAKAGAANGLEKIWLDARVKASLERSVPQVGAPQAWQAGYDGTGVKVAVLDTGADETHPDLAGRVDDRRNFTDDPTTEDGVGHGTHVASIIAGQGSASAGLRKGVAPGARLLVGKVLDNTGSGTLSQVIEGLEWAAGAGADVVNLSLGSGPTDGTDPLSVAVDELTASTGTLFVAAAGNEGRAYQVGAPGAATTALTVGAVDRDDALASFSSRGPRLDDAPKPDITAPGVGIAAARAAGTTMGDPVDERYIAASGTSMATPHVAGAAAILKQRHPGWTAGRLKDALVSTAATIDGQTVHEQGGGRLDVARAVRQDVTATGVLDLGTSVEGESGQDVQGKVAYTNTGTAPVTLDLSAALRNQDGAVPGEGALALGSTAVTVPAGGTAEVPVRVDLTKIAKGRHVGYLTARSADGSVAAHTTLALTRRGPARKVHFRAIDDEGKPSRVAAILMYGAAAINDASGWIEDRDAGLILEVEQGTYLTQAVFGGISSRQQPLDVLISIPELKVDRDLEVVLDARKAKPVVVETPKPAVRSGITTWAAYRTYGDRRISIAGMNFPSDLVTVAGTDRVKNGTFEFNTRLQLAAPMVSRARVTGLRDDLPMQPAIWSPEMDGRFRWPLMEAGRGRPEDVAGRDVRGKAVVISLPSEEEDFYESEERIRAIGKAGAAAVIAVGGERYGLWQQWLPVNPRYPSPAFLISHDAGQKLLGRVRAGRATIDLTCTMAPPYTYDVSHSEYGGIPRQIVHKVRPGNTARIAAEYTESGGEHWAKEQRFGWRPWQVFANERQTPVRTPLRRDEYVSSSDADTTWEHFVHSYFTWELWGSIYGGGVAQPERGYRPGEIVRERWWGPLVRPAIPAGYPYPPTRDGDEMTIIVPEMVDGDGHYGYLEQSLGEDETSARLFRNGELVAERANARDRFPAVPEEAEYRLELSTSRTSPEWVHATATETAWTFRSRGADREQVLPMPQVDYDVPADENGLVPAGRPVSLGFTVRGTVPGMKVGQMTAELSYDDGATWTPVRLRSTGGGGYTGQVTHRAGTVSLRVAATDRAGNRVEQKIIRGYGVR